MRLRDYTAPAIATTVIALFACVTMQAQDDAGNSREPTSGQSSNTGNPGPLFADILGENAAASLVNLLAKAVPGDFQLVEGYGKILSTEPRYGHRGPTGGPFSLQKLPSSFTIIFWTQLAPDSPPAVLLGLGDPHDGYLMLARDSSGAPTLLMYGDNETTQTSRAPRGAANLADGSLHSIAVINDRASGLVQIYVDGQPEVATVTTGFSMKRIGRAFAQWTVSDSILGSQASVYSPRVINRALTQEELMLLEPGKSGKGNSRQQAMAKLSDFNASLFAQTLAVFSLPPSGSRVMPNRVATGRASR